MQKYNELLSKYPLISDQIDRGELSIIMRELETQLSRTLSGSVVEFGCYAGTTSLFIRRLLNAYRSEIAFHVYDSFAGLPEKSDLDTSPAGEQFRVGELAVSKKKFILNFIKANLQPPLVHKEWFEDLNGAEIPNDITFAFLDGDYYSSVKIPLQLIERKLAPSATIVVDDYANEALPGAAKAVDEWVSRHGYEVQVARSLAIIHT